MELLSTDTAYSLSQTDTFLLGMNSTSTSVFCNTTATVAPTVDHVIDGGDIARCIFTIIVALLAFSLNTINILAVMKTDSLRNVGGYFIVNLAAADIALGIVVTLCIYPALTERWPYGDVMCQIAGMMLMLFIGTSVWGIMFMSIDRYIAIGKPLQYPMIMTETKCYIMIAFSWIPAVIVCSLPLMGFDKYTYNVNERMCGAGSLEAWRFVLLYIVYVAPPALSVYAVNIKILRIARKTIRRVQAAELFYTRRPSGIQRQIKAARTVGMIVITFTLTWVPCIIWNLVAAITGKPIPSVAEYIIMWTGLCNSFLNFFIYNVMNTHFREAVCKLFSKCRPDHKDLI